LTTSSPEQKRRSILLVILFTLLSAGAQVLMKTGANRLALGLSVQAILWNLPLIAGLALYGLGAVMIVLALQHGELSLIYPMISLSYVWVAVLSVVIFHETLNSLRIAGICVIMAGVATLGKGSHR